MAKHLSFIPILCFHLGIERLFISRWRKRAYGCCWPVSISQSRDFSFQDGFQAGIRLLLTSCVSISQSRDFSFQVITDQFLRFFFSGFPSRNREDLHFKQGRQGRARWQRRAVSISQSRGFSGQENAEEVARDPDQFPSRNREAFRVKQNGELWFENVMVKFRSRNQGACLFKDYIDANDVEPRAYLFRSRNQGACLFKKYAGNLRILASWVPSRHQGAFGFKSTITHKNNATLNSTQRTTDCQTFFRRSLATPQNLLGQGVGSVRKLWVYKKIVVFYFVFWYNLFRHP